MVAKVNPKRARGTILGQSGKTKLSWSVTDSKDDTTAIILRVESVNEHAIFLGK